MEAKWMSEDSLPEHTLIKTKKIFIVPKQFDYFDGCKLSGCPIIHSMRLATLCFWYKKAIIQ